MKKVIGRMLVGLLVVFTILVIYILWDNNRIKIVKQEVVMDNLPSHLEEFTVLQISDLHEKEFGKNQKRLIKKINQIDYDVLIFTGDIINGMKRTDYDSIYLVLEGIHNKENILFVPGNTDPPSYQVNDTLQKSKFIRGMEERGARLLESMDKIDTNGKSIHFVNFELSIIRQPNKIGNVNGMSRPYHASDERYQAYQQELWEEMIDSNIFNASELVIALNHFPVPDARVDYILGDPATEWRNFDLIIAGHYHGGQIRIPFFGAIFIPDPWYEPNSFFPPQDRVKGLWEYNETKQYVSAGLGSSESVPYLNFRLFNPPEINVLTFVR